MSKNFTKLEVGSWYLNRSGAVAQIVDVRSGQFPYLSSQGGYFDSAGTSSKASQKLNLVTEIESLLIKPKKKKKKVKKTLRRYCNVYLEYPAMNRHTGGTPFAFMYETKADAIRNATKGQNLLVAGFEILVEYAVEE